MKTRKNTYMGLVALVALLALIAGTLVLADTPTTVKRTEVNSAVEFPTDNVIKENNKYYLVFRQASVFNVVECYSYDAGDETQKCVGGLSHEVTFYNPIKAGTKLVDVLGATHAIDDGTHWTFAHAHPGEHHDIEAIAEALVITHFQPLINAALIASVSATDITARTLAVNQLKTLVDFAEDAQEAVETAIRKRTLGEHVRDASSTGHHRDVAVAGIQAAKADWTKRAKTDVFLNAQLTSITTKIDGVVTDLTEAPAIKTRAEKAAADAAAESTQDD